MESQLNILSESLDQKIRVLGQIREFNEKQANAFSGATADLDEYDKAFDEKDRLIDSLTRLDDGFEVLYDRLAEELKENRVKYAFQIKELQIKIEKVTELSTSIQAQEVRNKKLIEAYFEKARAGIKQNRQSSRAAYDYYKNMSGANYGSNSILDSRQ